MNTASVHHRRYPTSLSGWVAGVIDSYPDFDEYDVSAMLEEKTGVAVSPRDFEQIRASVLRAKLRAWSPAAEESVG